jgi:hypothetical protein
MPYKINAGYKRVNSLLAHRPIDPFRIQAFATVNDGLVSYRPLP